jgi:hypothetical protein
LYAGIQKNLLEKEAYVKKVTTLNEIFFACI